MRHPLACLALLAAGCVNPGRESGRFGGVEESPPTQAPPFVIDGGFGARAVPADAGISPNASCIFRSELPVDCDPVGEWRLLHSQPEGDCPFGASRHVIRLLDGISRVCLEESEDFRRLEPGPSGRCALRLTGTHQVSAAAQPYTEFWISDLTFTGNTGTGETVVMVSGGNNCMRKFQTAIDRK